MAEKFNKPTDSTKTGAILEMKVVSKPDARVRETVVVLSDAAKKRLVVKGRVPAREE